MRSDPTRARDLRLDVFRGLGMFIILIAHIPANPWTVWIPARFGFSDATEIFVFCSGLASALAFGKIFDRAGLALGAARVVHRIWQVWLAQLVVFIAVVALLGAADAATGGEALRTGLNMATFLDDPAGRLAGLMTLTWVPNYFDILPMYLVVLALIPAAMLVERTFGGAAILGASAVLWLLANGGFLDLPADVPGGSGRAWFFNPFAWQFVFFLGFGFVRGWIAPPPRHGALVAASLVVVVTIAPFSCNYGWSCHLGFGFGPWFGAVHDSLGVLIDKTRLGPLRILHFVALAHLAYVAAGAGGRRLAHLPGVDVVALVGRQTLPVFLAGLVVAQGLGAILDLTGRGAGPVALVNLGGCILVVAVAAVSAWFKRAPWATPAPGHEARPTSASGRSPAMTASAAENA